MQREENIGFRKERAWHVLEAARGQNIAEVEESSERWE